VYFAKVSSAAEIVASSPKHFGGIIIISELGIRAKVTLIVSLPVQPFELSSVQITLKYGVVELFVNAAST